MTLLFTCHFIPQVPFLFFEIFLINETVPMVIACVHAITSLIVQYILPFILSTQMCLRESLLSVSIFLKTWGIVFSAWWPGNCFASVFLPDRSSFCSNIYYKFNLKKNVQNSVNCNCSWTFAVPTSTKSQRLQD